MKTVLMVVCVVFASGAFAADCVTNSNGKTVCSDGQKAVAVDRNTGTVKSAERGSGGATTVQGGNGANAAYNPNTGRGAVSKTDGRGVTTTKSAGGGEVKSRNGVGVATTADGTLASRAKTIRAARKSSARPSPGKGRTGRDPRSNEIRSAVFANSDRCCEVPTTVEPGSGPLLALTCLKAHRHGGHTLF